MKQVFRNKKISGLLTILPEQEIWFDDEVTNYSFPAHQTMRLKTIMGYKKHRLVKPDTAVSDLCVFGMNYLFQHGYLQKEDVDAMILVTQSPDYYMPPTSNVIQGTLGLKRDMLCMDINQGCCGYLLGLMQAFMLLELESVNKVVLVNADVLSKKVSKQDRNSYPLAGDAATITIVENAEQQNPIYFNLYMDGTRGHILKISAGGFRLPADSRTAEVRDCGDGNLRSQEHLAMDGAEVFQFVQQEVPPMIEELKSYAGVDDDGIDYYLFHQPNRFMLEKLAARMGVAKEKMPMNIVSEYGNSSGCTIPVNIVHNLGDSLTSHVYKCCLAGFGSGLTWSSMIMDLGFMEFAEQIIAPY